MSELKVIDIFCGAGGFSEGFRQQGFEIVMGIDNWDPAIRTFNHNFNLQCSTRNVLDFENSIEEIENLPDTEIIIGSPPCVTFSNSNNSGKADKSTGIRLTKIFLRIVAIKKYKKGSTLKAWLMENVTNSTYHLKDHYTFRDLRLTKWAKLRKLDPLSTAIVLKENQHIINSANYGSPQIRKRVISGEFIETGKLIVPAPLYQEQEEDGNLPPYLTLGWIRNNMPKPTLQKSNHLINDPLYPSVKIKRSELSDHFYDTGLYKCVWKNSEYLKTNHPYMGRMSFPENEKNPSRTICATNIGTSRESIIYKSDFDRSGDGAYRTPTVREAATIMSFPYTYQFVASEGSKHRLVGNAVCPSVSRAFAAKVREALGLPRIVHPIVQLEADLKQVTNLNTYDKKPLTNPPKKKTGSRFRRHPFKDGNITVTLSNYDIVKNEKNVGKWITSVQYGNGNGFPTFNFPDGFYKKLKPIITKLNGGEKFLDIVNNGFTEKIGRRVFLQEMYEMKKSKNGLLEPTELVEELKKIIERLNVENEKFTQKEYVFFKNKESVPIKQLFALYAISKISTIANK